MPAAKAVVICVRSLVHNRLALPPVDRDVGTIYEAAPGRGKKGHQGRALAWLADTAEWDRPLAPFVTAPLGHPLFAGERLLHHAPAVGVHCPRFDRVTSS